MFYKLIAIVLSATSGDVVTEYEEIQKPMTLEKCNERQMEKGITYVEQGNIKVYVCRKVEVV